MLVGAGAADITPPLEVGILMSAAERRWEPFAGVRLPLSARALLIQQERRQVALVSLDLLGLSSRAVGGMRSFKRRAVASSGLNLKTTDLILTCTHTHSAPESLGLTDLCRTSAFQSWVGQVARQLGTALAQAARAAQPARLAIGSTRAEALSVHRRIRTIDGVVLRRPDIPADKIISETGPQDDTVTLAALLDEDGRPIGMIANAACHPVHEMCLRQVAPDYPGEMCLALERRHRGTVCLFLNGAAGNLDPLGVSDGPQAARRHGLRLAEVVERALPDLSPSADTRLALARRSVSLPGKTLRGGPAQRPLRAEVAALRIGDLALVFLPGEPFAEIGLEVRRRSPFPLTAVVGYAEDYLGYLPTEAAHDEGGYELGPGRWARVGRGAEGILLREAASLLSLLWSA